MAVHTTQNGPIAATTNIIRQLLDLISPDQEGGTGDDIPLVLQEPSWLLLKIILFSKVTTTWERLGWGVREKKTVASKWKTE